MASLHRLIVNEELQLRVIQNIEALEEQFSWAFNLKNFDFIIENAFWRYKFAEPTCLQIKHIGCVILEYVEKTDLYKYKNGY